MAATKIATLAIRTLAKPIASQIKQQAQQHQRFRAICISLAQFMHRTEMIMRTNLLRPPAKSSANTHKDGKDGKEHKDKDGKHEEDPSHHKPRIRPLNEAKAVANGANALAEGFLFALAAALILGESYRGSRSRAKQRDRTEQGLEELRLITRSLAERIGADWREIEQRAQEIEDAVSEVENGVEGSDDTGTKAPRNGQTSDGTNERQGAPYDGMASTSSKDSPILAKAEQLRREREALVRDRDRLQHAVDVLLRMSIKSGWIQGAEALQLQDVLDGKDGKEKEQQKGNDSATPTSLSTSDSSKAGPLDRLRSSASGPSQVLEQVSRIHTGDSSQRGS